MAYNNAKGCNANGLTVYRYYESDVDNSCIRFDTLYANVLCEQFERGGQEKTDCTDDPLDPQSIQFYADDSWRCEAWWADDCKGPSDEPFANETHCEDRLDVYKSFSCRRY